ncbi:hypothetical protein HAX54_005686, partial [Datura stramonium]|nr:hypothetical protein [Datura stramonium]
LSPRIVEGVLVVRNTYRAINCIQSYDAVIAYGAIDFFRSYELEFPRSYNIAYGAINYLKGLKAWCARDTFAVTCGALG